jgi:hypothetical protein
MTARPSMAATCVPDVVGLAPLDLSRVHRELSRIGVTLPILFAAQRALVAGFTSFDVRDADQRDVDQRLLARARARRGAMGGCAPATKSNAEK